jgi:hypothetical protein
MNASKHIKNIKVNFSMLRQARAKTNSIIFLKHALLFIDKI